MTTRWSFFLLFEHVAFLAKYVVSQIIPDMPPEVEMQLQRQDFLVDKVIGDQADDDDGEVELKSGRANIIISETDGDWEEEIKEDEAEAEMVDQGGEETKKA